MDAAFVLLDRNLKDSIALEPMTRKLIVIATGYVVQANIRDPHLDSLVAEHIR